MFGWQVNNPCLKWSIFNCTINSCDLTKCLNFLISMFSHTAWVMVFTKSVEFSGGCKRQAGEELPENVFQDAPVVCTEVLHVLVKSVSTDGVCGMNQPFPVTPRWWKIQNKLLVLKSFWKKMTLVDLDFNNKNITSHAVRAPESETRKTVLTHHRPPWRRGRFGCCEFDPQVLSNPLQTQLRSHWWFSLYLQVRQGIHCSQLGWIRSNYFHWE